MLQGIGLVDIPKQSQFQKFDPSDLIFQAYDFPSYPNLEHLCKQRDDGVSGQHMTWDAFASESLLDSVVNYYRENLGNAGFTKEEDGGTWRFPTGVSQPERVLTIMPVGAIHSYCSCDKKPSANSRSIVILYRFSRAAWERVDYN
jgi:hypothetical protein